MIVKFQDFRTMPDGEPPLGHQWIPCRMIFDEKFDGKRKARFVAGGHRTNDPDEDECSGVVAPEAICLNMFTAIYNDLKIIVADIGNAYLLPPKTSK